MFYTLDANNIIYVHTQTFKGGCPTGEASCDVGPGIGGGGDTAVAGTVPVDIRVGRGT